MRLGEPLRELPDGVPVVLATGGFQADRELVARHITPKADELMLRAAPWSTGDGLRLGLAAGGTLSDGMDEFYGRNMPAPPARVRSADFVRARAAVRAHTRPSATRAGDVYEPRTWSEIDVVQWTARQPGARAWYAVADERARRARARPDGRRDDRRRRGRPARRVRAARRRDRRSRSSPGSRPRSAACASTRDARVAPGVFAAGADTGGIATGGYASGLAAALVFGRIAAESALRG